MPDLEVRYVADTSTGLFEQTAERYGEVHYQFAGRERVSRATTAEGVLEAIYDVVREGSSDGSEASPQEEDDERESVFRGYPLAEPPAGAAAVFYGAWPAIT